MANNRGSTTPETIELIICEWEWYGMSRETSDVSRE